MILAIVSVLLLKTEVAELTGESLCAGIGESSADQTHVVRQLRSSHAFGITT